MNIWKDLVLSYDSMEIFPLLASAILNDRCDVCKYWGCFVWLLFFSSGAIAPTGFKTVQAPSLTSLKVSWFQNVFMVSSFWPKNQKKNCKDYSFLGASWKLFGATCKLPHYLYYLLSPQEGKNKPGQKSLQYFCCYFGRNDGSKKTFRN